MAPGMAPRLAPPLVTADVVLEKNVPCAVLYNTRIAQRLPGSYRGGAADGAR
jgi:hypothetical protein